MRFGLIEVWSQLKQSIAMDRGVQNFPAMKKFYADIFKIFNQDLSGKLKAVDKAGEAAGNADAAGQEQANQAWRDSMVVAMQVLDDYLKVLEIMKAGVINTYPNFGGGFTLLNATMERISTGLSKSLYALNRDM